MGGCVQLHGFGLCVRDKLKSPDRNKQPSSCKSKHLQEPVTARPCRHSVIIAGGSGKQTRVSGVVSVLLLDHLFLHQIAIQHPWCARQHAGCWTNGCKQPRASPALTGLTLHSPEEPQSSSNMWCERVEQRTDLIGRFEKASLRK